MEPRLILARAEASKRKLHHLSLELRLKSPQEARKLLKEHSLLLWNRKSELPNLLDAMLGRVASERERGEGRLRETCSHWRREMLQDNDLVECRFFRRLATVLHQDLWPAATFFALRNRKLAEESERVSRLAARIVKFLVKEGATPVDKIRRALRLESPASVRALRTAKRELQERLIVLSKDDVVSNGRAGKEVLILWEGHMSRPVLTRADQMSEAEARLKVLSATLQSCVLSEEKNLRRWFVWDGGDLREPLDKLVARGDFLRFEHQRQKFIVPRKLLTSR